MIVLVRWCYNVDCHSVGRVPLSYPRGVRRPTALLCFYPMPFLSVTSVCLGTVRFGLFTSHPSLLSFVPFLFVSLCAVWSCFRFPPPFMFMYCVKVLWELPERPYRSLAPPCVDPGRCHRNRVSWGRGTSRPRAHRVGATFIHNKR